MPELISPSEGLNQSPYLKTFYGAKESIPNLTGRYGEIDSLESIPGLFKRLQIRALATGQRRDWDNVDFATKIFFNEDFLFDIFDALPRYG